MSATGHNNTALGLFAGIGITTGSNIIAIGWSIDGVSTTNGEVDDSCYIGNIVDAGVDADTAQSVFVDQDGKLGTMALPNTGNLPSAKVFSDKIRELQTTVAQQAKAIEIPTAQLKKQATLIQKMSAQVEASKFATRRIRGGGPAPQVVQNNP